jgi:hypothetical protein
MSITSPAELLKELDVEFFTAYRHLPDANMAPVEYVEPDLRAVSEASTNLSALSLDDDSSKPDSGPSLDTITSKIVTLGDLIDTDAVSPTFF